MKNPEKKRPIFVTCVCLGIIMLLWMCMGFLTPLPDPRPIWERLDIMVEMIAGVILLGIGGIGLLVLKRQGEKKKD